MRTRLVHGVVNAAWRRSTQSTHPPTTASLCFLFVQIAADIRYILNAYDKVIPTVLEIPSKDKPYHEDQDPIMQRVLKLMGSRD